MKERQGAENRHVSRREVIGRLAAGLGAVSVLRSDVAFAGGAAQAPASATGTVQTVLGPIDTSNLGFTLSHEHITATSPGLRRAWPELFGDRARFVNDTVDTLKQAKDEGVDSFVDVTTFDLGRDIRLMEEISRKSGVQVIACTGHWIDGSFSMNARTVQELAEFFTREIEVGIEDTDIKAGVIKVANGGEITEFGEKVLRAAARVSRATGVPITTHAPAGNRIGERQAAIFEAEGLSPSKACIGHSDDSRDQSYTLGLARRGYHISMDHVSRSAPAPGAADGPPTLEERMMIVKAHVDAGGPERIMLGNDWLFAATLFPTVAIPDQLAQNPDGVLFVTRKALPALRALGVTEQAIRAMTVDGPKRFFDGV